MFHIRINIIFFFFFFTSQVVKSQETVVHRTLNWSDSLKNVEFSDYKKRETLNFTEAVYDYSRFGSLPVYTESFYIGNNTSANAEIKNPVFVPVKNLFSSLSSEINPVITPVVSISYQNKKAIADFFIVPLRKNPQTGAIEKLISFDIALTSSGSYIEAKKTRGGAYTSSSVLATGNWYKISVDKDGIYKIDKAFLQSLGIDVKNINPLNIRIYGNGGGMLPESNAAFRYDDLQENAIQVVGENDGSFDDSDYILFYGQGPVRWSLDTVSNVFRHKANIYSDVTYYFLSTDLGPGKRIALQNSSNQSPNQTFTTFDDYAVHERDTTNLLKSGREWYGEQFKYITSQDFSFSFSNLLNTEAANLLVNVASRSLDGPRSFFVNINGQVVSPIVINAVPPEYTDPVAAAGIKNYTFSPSGNNVRVNLTYSSSANDASGWLNYLELNIKRNLVLSGNQMPFRVINSVGANNFSEFKFLQVSGQLSVWDVTDPLNVKNQELLTRESEKLFTLNTSSLNEFIAFNGKGFFIPGKVGKIPNQNLHAPGQYDYIVVTPAVFNPAASDLAKFREEQSNLKSLVVNTDQIYNEFASGSPDVTAIRDYIRMLYERAADSSEMPKFLVLFGDGSYDYKNRLSGNTNFVPTFESYESLSPTSSFNTDDYFGFLDITEGSNMLLSNIKLDIAIGRLPVKTTDEAASMVNKIKMYASSASFGSWRNVITFSADDEDGNTHINDAEDIANYVAGNYPAYNIDKIYLDAYKQVSTPGGARYPDVNAAITNKIYSGTLIFNYLGHGGTTGLAHERILSNADFLSWQNCYRLPVFVTATCEFSRFDNPQETSAGEYLMLNPCGGAISLVTTMRLVYSFANKDLNLNFNKQIFRTINNAPIEIGTALKMGKNNVTSDGTNNRKFALLGDPALTLQNSSNKVITSSINSHPLNAIPDTMKALQKVTVTGYISDVNGNKLPDFSGVLYPTIFDKISTYTTLKNDPSSYVRNFIIQKNIIYNGKASVKNGEFSFTFIVPKDIGYKYGLGKISYSSDNGKISASGYNSDVIIGGFEDSVQSDYTGPSVSLYMNDEKFVFGGTTDENPFLLVKLKDDNGINTVGTGLGHDISGVLDENSQTTFVLNNYYEANLDDYRSGVIKYPMKDLAAGRHSLSVKAWDVYNNSSQGYTEFVVASSSTMALTHVLNYPNPFTTQTEFMFEHNMPGAMLNVKVEIYTVSGKLIKTIHTTAGNILQPASVSLPNAQCDNATISGSYRVDGIYWDGLDDFGDPIGKGVYIYRVSVKAENGLQADKFEKLVLLK